MKSLLKRRLCATVVWLGLVLAASPETYYVATNGVEARTGIGDWTNAVLAISNAVAKATAINDLILVSNGEYILTAQINISSQITVRSWNNGIMDSTNTVINGNGVVRCFSISHTGAVVEGLTIFNGRTAASGGGGELTLGQIRSCLVVSNYAAGASGGGLYVRNGLVADCVIAHNIATNGGGIYAYTTGSQSAQITNCVIRDNRALVTTGAASGGGGIMLERVAGSCVMADSRVYRNESTNNGGGVLMSRSGVEVRNCWISNNFALVSGGGVKIYSAGLITNCTVISNSCGSYGGGIHGENGAIIANCRIIGNRATSSGDKGGGVYGITASKLLNSEVRDNRSNYGTAGVYAKGMNVRNCLIIGNVATSHYGGVLIEDGGVVENCTIVSNQSLTSSGGGVGMFSSGYTNYMANCIVYDNFAATSLSNYENYASSSGGLSYSNNCLAPAFSGTYTNQINPYSTNNIFVDPQFIGSSAGNYHLDRSSPCINAGANRDWMPNAGDLDGRSRIDRFSGQVDMGCFENIPSGTMVTVP